MEVKLLISRVGVGFSQIRGDVISVEDAEAERMIAAGQAEIVETAAKKPVENAAGKGKKKK
jgi:hypothetical protein